MDDSNGVDLPPPPAQVMKFLSAIAYSPPLVRTPTATPCNGVKPHQSTASVGETCKRRSGQGAEQGEGQVRVHPAARWVEGDLPPCPCLLQPALCTCTAYAHDSTARLPSPIPASLDSGREHRSDRHKERKHSRRSRSRSRDKKHKTRSRSRSRDRKSRRHRSRCVKEGWAARSNKPPASQRRSCWVRRRSGWHLAGDRCSDWPVQHLERPRCCPARPAGCLWRRQTRG